jgi:hypothetical protein
VLLNGGRIEAVGTDNELKNLSALYRRLHEIHYHGAHPDSAGSNPGNHANGSARVGGRVESSL